jgi:Na+/H+-dicarboxylate symporter
MSLHTRILVAMGIGLVVGLIMSAFGNPDAPAFKSAIWWFDLLGRDIFVGGLKMIIAPLILASIVAGVYSLPSPREIRNVGLKTLVYYFCTTAIAVFIGMVAVLVVRPGEQAASQTIRSEREAAIETYRAQFEQETGVDSRAGDGEVQFRMYIAAEEGEGLEGGSFQTNWSRMKEAGERSPLDTIRDEILRPMLLNPFNSLAQNPPNALGIILFALLVGVALVLIGEPARPVGDFFESLNRVMLVITLWIMELAPIGVGCIIASLVATLGTDALISLGWYGGTVLGGIAIHCCVLLALVWVVGRMHPLEFIRGIRDAWLVAFTTSSSAATLPVSIVCTTQKLGVSNKIARFTLPVGATVNMDGTALYEGVAIIFLIQIFGGLPDVPIDLSFVSLFLIFITAVLASIGAAAVPSAGLVTMALVASAVGLPLYYIVIIYAIDRLLDMFRTSTNVMGDMVGAVIVNRLEAGRLAAEEARDAVSSESSSQ